MYGEGVSATGDLLDNGVAVGVVEKSGSWYAYEGERIGQGRENAKRFLKDNADVYEAVLTKVRQKMNLEPVEASESEEK
jgi:recombination protein RecA